MFWQIAYLLKQVKLLWDSLNDAIATLNGRINNLQPSTSDGGGMAQGDGPPVDPPANTNRTAIYYDRVSGKISIWNTLLQEWQ